MHGASESAAAPYPYLHTMGPRDWRSTYHYGLAQGHLAGAVGSTDHHSAHPGSYGHGRLGAWAPELTRDVIWDAIQQRRVYALTGDRIALAFALNDGLMGQVLPPTAQRHHRRAAGCRRRILRLQPLAAARKRGIFCYAHLGQPHDHHHRRAGVSLTLSGGPQTVLRGRFNGKK